MTETPAPRATRDLLRNRDYAGWWVGETVSGFGTALTAVAYPILMGSRSAAEGGIVVAAGNIGVSVTLLIGGAFADRYSRRAIATTGPLIQALCVASVAVAVATGHVLLWHVATVAFVQGLVGGLTAGAYTPMLRRVVPASLLPTAYGQELGRDQAIRLVGPAAGGYLFGLGRWVPFAGDAVSYLAAAAGVLAIRRPLGPDPTQRPARESVLRSIGTGVEFIRRSAYLRFLVVWIAALNACAGGMFYLVVLLVLRSGEGPDKVGLATSIGAVGGLAGALFGGRIARRLGGRPVVLVNGFVIAGVFAGISFASSYWAIGLLLATLMVVVVPLNVILMSYETRLVPDELSGRVSSAITFGANGFRFVGPLVAGFVALRWGPTAAGLLLTSVVTLVAVCAPFADGLHLLDRPIDAVADEPSTESRTHR